MKRTKSSAVSVLLGCLLAAAGCGGSVRAVRFSYEEPAVCELPASISTLAVAEFRQAGGEGWGGVVSQGIAEALKRATLPHRVRIVQTQVGKAASKPAVPGPVIVDTPSAVAWGKAVGADAVAYGTVAVIGSGERAGAKPTGGQVACQVVVNLVIDDVRSGRTVASLSVSQRYPPPQTAAPPGSAPAAPAAEAVVEELIAQCVDRLVKRLCPQTVWVNEQLQFGRTRLVLDGNHLARAGQYEQAMDCYLRAIELSSGDDGAVFNAAVMCEALGRLDEAQKLYERAAAMRPGEHTDQALKRLNERRAGRK
jgi:hypothetical protein